MLLKDLSMKLVDWLEGGGNNCDFEREYQSAFKRFIPGSRFED